MPDPASPDPVTWRSTLRHPLAHLEEALPRLDRAPAARDLDALRARYRRVTHRARRVLVVRLLLHVLVYVGVLAAVLVAIAQVLGVEGLAFLARTVAWLLGPLTLVFLAGLLLMNRVVNVLQTEALLTGLEIAATRR